MNTEQKRAAAILAAVALDYPADDRRADGKPHVSALNDRVEDGVAPVSAAERDAAWEQHSAREGDDSDAAQPESAEQVAETHDNPERAPNGAESVPADEAGPAPAPEAPAPEAAEIEAADVDPDAERVTITITRSAMSPVPLHVHGVGSFSLPLNKPVTVPRAALPALRDSDVEFTEGDL